MGLSVEQFGSLQLQLKLGSSGWSLQRALPMCSSCLAQFLSVVPVPKDPGSSNSESLLPTGGGTDHGYCGKRAASGVRASGQAMENSVDSTETGERQPEAGQPHPEPMYSSASS